MQEHRMQYADLSVVDLSFFRNSSVSASGLRKDVNGSKYKNKLLNR